MTIFYLDISIRPSLWPAKSDELMIYDLFAVLRQLIWQPQEDLLVIRKLFTQTPKWVPMGRVKMIDYKFICIYILVWS